MYPSTTNRSQSFNNLKKFQTSIYTLIFSHKKPHLQESQPQISKSNLISHFEPPKTLNTETNDSQKSDRKMGHLIIPQNSKLGSKPKPKTTFPILQSHKKLNQFLGNLNKIEKPKNNLNFTKKTVLQTDQSSKLIKPSLKSKPTNLMTKYDLKITNFSLNKKYPNKHCLSGNFSSVLKSSLTNFVNVQSISKDIKRKSMQGLTEEHGFMRNSLAFPSKLSNLTQKPIPVKKTEPGKYLFSAKKSLKAKIPKETIECLPDGAIYSLSKLARFLENNMREERKIAFKYLFGDMIEKMETEGVVAVKTAGGDEGSGQIGDEFRILKQATFEAKLFCLVSDFCEMHFMNVGTVMLAGKIE